MTKSRHLRFAIFTLLLATAPAMADDEPEKQKESDWVDARWSLTDIGNFHSSLLSLPNGIVAKGLSVRVGERGEAAVVYDTASATWRAGWSGGFLKFNGSRYGLIQPPQPAGEVRLFAPAQPAWGNAAARWHGFHVRGPRIVLDYEIAGMKVIELPGHEAVQGVAAFTRAFTLGSHTEPLTLTLLDGKGRDLKLVNQDGVNLATLANSRETWTIAVTGNANAELRLEGEALKLRLPAAGGPRIAKVFMAAGAPADVPQFAALVKASAPPADLSALTQPGPPRWQPLTTRGQLGFGSDAFVVDTLTVPYENPWKALFFTSGVDFLPNGDAAVCTIHGDVWRVSGIDEKLERLTWRRFATGLFQPLGLKVRDGRIYVLGRDQISVLHDENGDGEADFYENFFNGIRTSTGGHDYVTSLETDTNGNFYYVDPRGAHRVSADGRGQETLAAGWRNPNGLGASPDGRIITVAPQQGEWTPSSAICEARPGGWYGYGGPRVTAERPLGYDPPLCWIPHSVDNSGGSQVWVTSDRWGPLQGHMLHFSFGRCSQFLVLREMVGGMPQGALVPLPGRFLSGAMRGAFNPHDGQLYVVGLRGWQTSAARDGCLQRARFTGKTPLVPVEFHAQTNGLRLAFTAPLDRATAEDTGSYGVAQWNYRYSATYGSKDYSPSEPGKEGRDTLVVKSATLLPDGRGLFLEIPALRPVMQIEVKYSLKTSDGKVLRSQLHGTINKLGPAFAKPSTPSKTGEPK